MISAAVRTYNLYATFFRGAGLPFPHLVRSLSSERDLCPLSYLRSFLTLRVRHGGDVKRRGNSDIGAVEGTAFPEFG